MSRWQEAIDAVSSRTTAAAGLPAHADEAVSFAQVRPREMVRRLLSGYVDTEDTDAVEAMILSMAEALVVMAHTKSPLDATLAVAINIAQLIPAGVELGRSEDRRAE